MIRESFIIKLLQDFKNFLKPSEGKKVLLILDNDNIYSNLETVLQTISYHIKFFVTGISPITSNIVSDKIYNATNSAEAIVFKNSTNQ